MVEGGRVRRNVPDYSFAFVRGVGWVAVRELVNLQRGAAVREARTRWVRFGRLGSMAWVASERCRRHVGAARRLDMLTLACASRLDPVCFRGSFFGGVVGLVSRACWSCVRERRLIDGASEAERRLHSSPAARLLLERWLGGPSAKLLVKRMIAAGGRNPEGNPRPRCCRPSSRMGGGYRRTSLRALGWIRC